MLQGKVHMAQFSVKIRHPVGSVLAEKQQSERLYPWNESDVAFNPYRDVGRNDPCPCGSGKKYKKCCLN